MDQRNSLVYLIKSPSTLAFVRMTILGLGYFITLVLGPGSMRKTRLAKSWDRRNKIVYILLGECHEKVQGYNKSEGKVKEDTKG